MDINRLPHFALLFSVVGVAACRRSLTPANVELRAVLPAAGVEGLATIRGRVINALAHDSAVSISLAVAVSGRIVWQEAFGSADRERRIPASVATRYGIGSISKPMTATGLMLLVQREQVGLGQPVNTYLGAAALTGHASDANQATVRLVLQHRAGLPEQNRFYFANEPARRMPLDTVVRRYAFLANVPDDRYDYSNLGYGVVERIIERASAMDYATFMEREVFEPLNLASTSVGPVSTRTALLYETDRSVVPYFDFDTRGAGYIYSTAHDVLRFGMFHLKEHLPDQKPILSDSMVDEMVRDRRSSGSASGVFGLDWWYGLGWGGRTASEVSFDWYGHEGGMPGASSILRMVPSHRIAVAVLSNSRQSLTYELADAILDVLLPDWPARRLRDPTRVRPNQPAVLVPLPRELLGVWNGHVATSVATVPVTLRLLDGVSATLRIGSEAEAPISNLSFAGERLTGRASATVPDPQVGSDVDGVRLSLWLRDGALVGSITAASLAPRYPFWLPFAARLSKDR